MHSISKNIFRDTKDQLWSVSLHKWKTAIQSHEYIFNISPDKEATFVCSLDNTWGSPSYDLLLQHLGTFKASGSPFCPILLWNSYMFCCCCCSHCALLLSCLGCNSHRGWGLGLRQGLRLGSTTRLLTCQHVALWGWGWAWSRSW